MQQVEDLILRNPMVEDPVNVLVQLNNPDRDSAILEYGPHEEHSLDFKVKHLCGGHEYKFDIRRAKYAGCIVDTIKKPAVIAEGNGHRFYLRRYKDGTLHIVITTLPKNGECELEGIGFQRY